MKLRGWEMLILCSIAYIMFDNIEQSKLARKFLSMKKFNNKLIYIQYLPEENFINKKFEPII